MPDGTALYVRRISKRRHGEPKDLARRFKDGGCKWVAIGGPWHEKRGNKISTGLMNPVGTCRDYSDAMAAEGIQPFIWGYPWQGTEQKFAEQMAECAGEHKRGLLDPELGSNPSRSSKGHGKAQADAHAKLLVELMAAQGFTECGLSTFGSGWRMGWFPLLAFTRALLEHFRGHTFIGGQTYTDDGVIDRSISDMIKTIEAADPAAVIANVAGVKGAHIEVVPNFGTYTWTLDGKRGKRRKGAKAVRKTPEELIHHLSEFIDDGEPVDAMIGWAENFMNDALWAELAKFSAWLERGACRLPVK